MFSKRIALAVLAVVALPCHASAQTSALPDSVIHLRFGWPAGTTARVEAGRYRIRNADGKSDTTALNLTYRMRLHDHPAGHAIRYDQFEFENLAGNDAARTELNEQLSALMPSLLVDTAGAFLRVENVTAMKALMDSVMQSTVPKDSLPAQTQALLTNLTSEAVLNALAAQEWNALIGTWIGADLELGAVYEATESAPIPIFPGKSLPMVTQYNVAERVECVEGSGRLDCVELRMVSTPDADSVKALMKEIMQNAVNMPEAPVFEQFDLETSIVLIAEPATLLPHYYSMVKTVTARIKVAGESTAVSQEEERTYSFSYDSR